MWFLVVFQHDLHDQYLPQGKEKLLLKTTSVSKEEVVDVHLHSHRTAQNKYYGVISKRMNFNCPIVETSDSTDSNDDLELKQSLIHFLESSSLKCNEET